MHNKPTANYKYITKRQIVCQGNTANYHDHINNPPDATRKAAPSASNAAAFKTILTATTLANNQLSRLQARKQPSQITTNPTQPNTPKQSLLTKTHQPIKSLHAVQHPHPKPQITQISGAICQVSKQPKTNPPLAITLPESHQNLQHTAAHSHHKLHVHPIPTLTTKPQYRKVMLLCTNMQAQTQNPKPDKGNQAKPLNLLHHKIASPQQVAQHPCREQTPGAHPQNTSKTAISPSRGPFPAHIPNRTQTLESQKPQQALETSKSITKSIANQRLKPSHPEATAKTPSGRHKPEPYQSPNTSRNANTNPKSHYGPPFPAHNPSRPLLQATTFPHDIPANSSNSNSKLISNPQCIKHMYKNQMALHKNLSCRTQSKPRKTQSHMYPTKATTTSSLKYQAQHLYPETQLPRVPTKNPHSTTRKHEIFKPVSIKNECNLQPAKSKTLSARHARNLATPCRLPLHKQTSKHLKSYIKFQNSPPPNHNTPNSHQLILTENTTTWLHYQNKKSSSYTPRTDRRLQSAIQAKKVHATQTPSNPNRTSYMQLYKRNHVCRTLTSPNLCHTNQPHPPKNNKPMTDLTAIASKPPKASAIRSIHNDPPHRTVKYSNNSCQCRVKY
eukprot:gene3093-2075_t